MVGIILLPLLLAYIFPKLHEHSVWISALLFAFWKSPFSQPLIEIYNQVAWIGISRVVDFTDLYILVLLPIPYFLIQKRNSWDILKIKRVNPLLILLPTMFTFMATSPPPDFYYTRTEGNLACYKCNITVNFNQNEIVQKLGKSGIVFDSIAPIDTIALKRVPSLKNENVHMYWLNELIIDKDTLRNLDFTMRTIKNKKTRIYFKGMQVSDGISTVKLEISLRKYYQKILFKELKNILQD
jgi:hypothetical protein